MAILETANDILIDTDGNLNFLQDTSLWVYSAGDNTEIGATVIFNETDLQVPDVEKFINFVDVDYEGAFNLTFQLDGYNIHTFEFPDVSILRTRVWEDFPLTKRTAFRKLKMSISASDSNTKIYSIEVDFSILRRRRFN